MKKCVYELWVNKYFGLPDNFPEKATRSDFDYGNIVNLLATFDSRRSDELTIENEEAKDMVIQLTGMHQTVVKERDQYKAVLEEIIPVIMDKSNELYMNAYDWDVIQRANGLLKSKK